MKEHIRSRRVLTLCAVLLAAAPLAAQQGAPDDARRLYQMQTFEGILQTAVKQGADVLAQKVAAQLPGVQLTSSDPDAKGFLLPTPEGGFFFVVIVPAVREIVPSLLQLYPRPVAGRTAPGRSGTQSVSTQSTANADSMTASPTMLDGAPAAPLDADAVYSKAVADALIDAVIDNSGGLPLKETEWLTVAAIDGVAPTPGVINNKFGHTLYISAKGSDLMQFRQQKISRDEVRKLVKVKQN